MQWIETRSESSVKDENPGSQKIPARVLTDADIQNLPNYVAAEWEKPDTLLIAQRRAMSAFTSEFVLKTDPAQVLPQEIIPDFNDDDNTTKDSSQGNQIPLLSVRFRFILD